MGRLAELLADQTRVGGLSRRYLQSVGPVASAEFRRVRDLPRRTLQSDTELTQLLTQWLRKPHGTQVLRPAQAHTIAEAVDLRGALCTIGVGHGKTLASILSIEALAREHGVRRAVLLVPSGLRPATYRAIEAAKKDWHCETATITVVGHSQMGVHTGADLLTKLAPEVIVIDECHAFRARNTARTRRLLRYFKDHPGTLLVALSGTIVKKSLLDYWHLIRLTHGDEKAPVPRSWPEASTWASSMAADPTCPPGVLEEFCVGGEDVAEGFARRVRETPGVITTSEPSVGCSLILDTVETASPTILEKMRQVSEEWETPGGEMAADALQIYRLLSTTSLGFWHRLIFDSPEHKETYTEARRAWAQFCRDVLKRGLRGVDSELTVANAVDRGDVRGGERILADWREIKQRAPESVAEWYDTTYVTAVVQTWLKSGPGLVWVRHSSAGEMLSKALKIPYFGGGTGAVVESYRDHAAILSIPAHYQGRNLQHWHRNLVLQPSANGVEWQQLLGRTHRAGQTADEVLCDILVGTPWGHDVIERAKYHAKWLHGQTGEAQRLLFATWAHNV